MNNIFYDEWYKNRVNRIIDILGEDWFSGKKLLELGACHGDIGIEFLKLGADVEFTDVRQENLDVIKGKLNYDEYTPKTSILNQNFEYNLNNKFDLILHLGVLYHIENWQQDLKCAMNHTDMMFLETVVSPFKDIPDMLRDGGNHKYDGYNCKEPLFTQESVEKTLTDLGYHYIRFDNKSLNTNWNWLRNDCLVRHIYDWDYSNSQLLINSQHSSIEKLTHLRRFWLVLK